MRLTVTAAVLIAAYLLIVKPLLDKGDEAHHRLDRVSHCVENAHGNAHKIIRCSAKF